MKKLLLLCLVLLGGVMQASATETTHRFYALKKVTSWGTTLRIHVFNDTYNYYPTTWTSNVEDMTYIGTYDGGWVYYKDITIDDSYIDKLQVMFHDEGTNQTHYQISVPETDCTTPHLFTIGTDASVTTSNLELLLYENTNHTYTTMTTTDGKTYKTSIDYQSSPNSTMTYYIVPSFNKKDNDTPVSWDVCYRPNNNTAFTLNWQKYTEQTLSTADNNQYWFIDGIAAKFDISVNIYDMKWSCSPSFTRTIKSHGYSTFASDYDVAIPSGVTASYATGVENNELVMTNFTDGIPANTGALLYKAGGGDITFTPATSTNTATGNLFVRGGGTTIEQTVNGKTNYILTTPTGKTVGFYKANATNKNTVATTKAYLAVPNGSQAREFFTLGGETTGINAIENGQLTIDNNAPMYNLAGQRVNKSYKGVVIVNGKKMLNK